MKKIIFIAWALLLTGKLIAQDSTATRLDQLLSTYAKLKGFNGSVLIAKQGTVLLQKGYGLKNATAKIFNDADTKFQIASITKQFTAAVILKLVALKKMSLNDKLGKYYTGFAGAERITIEQLLTHTSGLRNFTEQDTSIEKTNEQLMVSYLETLKPDFAPGANWHYSNSGYIMLGYIIQKVSEMSYWDAIRTYIFAPLDITNSGFDFANATGDKATGYDVLTDSIQQPAAITDSTVPFAAGALYATVKDMYQWHKGLQHYLIVNKASTDKAYTPCGKSNYGYGWQIDSLFGHRVLSHSGAISGFSSNFARVQEDDICIVLLSNKSGTTGELMQITNKLLAILYHQPYSVPVKRIPVWVSEADLKQYLGTYEITDMHLTIEMVLDKGVLLGLPSREGHRGPTSVLLGLGNNRFYDQHDEELEISFDTDASRKVKGINILQMGIKRYAIKIK